MKRASILIAVVFVLAALLPSIASMQEGPALRLELSGVNALDLPHVELTINVYDALGQPVEGLTADDFVITGPLAEFARDVTVESVASSELPFATVLVIDASESMAGAPLERAKDAARLFVQIVRPIDPVAVIAFGSTVELLQDFTTDKDALLQAIDSIGLLGRTALYQAADDGVGLASRSPVPRRALILLSDGAEYGGLSTATASDVIRNAFLNGVPGYTVGLGYGAERTFLEELSRATEARFYESPTPEELDEIYAALAQRLSSQYIVSMTVDVPLDGHEYGFAITAERDGVVSNPISGSVRAPIPVPIVHLDDMPVAPVAEPTAIVVDIGADQPIDRVTLSIGGGADEVLAGPPWVLNIDPLDYPPGPLTLQVTAADTDGDVGSASATVEIAALPPLISLSRDLAELGAIDEPIDITVNPFGQTPIVSVQVSINGADPVALEPPYVFTLDPLQLLPGDNHLDVIVTNQAGLEAVYPADFIIADVPPVVSIGGLTEGQIIDAPVAFSVNGIGQTPVAETSASVNGALLAAVDGAFTLDPMAIVPGAAQLTVTAVTDRGQAGQAALTLMIAPLTPVVSIDGLSDGDTVNGDLPITIHVQAQTPATQGAVTLNGAQIASPSSFPAVVTLPFSAMRPGANELALTIQTSAGLQGALALTFTAPPALFTPTATPTATLDMPAIGTASAFAASTRTAVAQEAADIAHTGTAVFGTQSAATQAALELALTVSAEARAGQTQVASTRSAATEAAQQSATQAALEQLALTVTAEARAGQTQVASTRSAATEAAQQSATVTAQAATEAAQQSATVTAQVATEAAQQSAAVIAQAAIPTLPATLVPATRTPVPIPATPVPVSATSSPQPTPDTRGTLSAAAALVQEAAARARSTAEMQASMTQSAHQTATRAAADAQARATADAVSAQSTAQAMDANATQDAANAARTAQARATSQANTNQTATRLAQELMAATEQANRTATRQAAETTTARTSATGTAEAVLNSTAEAVTQAAGTAGAQEAGRTATADAGYVLATEGAQMTRTARAVLAAQTATAAVTVEAVSTTPPAPDATHTPQPTLTPVEAESSVANGTTSGLWVIFFVIILLAVAVVLWITRMRKRRFDK